MGGMASLVAGANVKPAVDGVVSVSAPARFMGMNATASARRLRVPVLYLAAEATNEGFDFSDDAREMYGATAAGDKQLQVLPDASTVSLSSRAPTGADADRGLPEDP